jgi:hypothetical protein
MKPFVDARSEERSMGMAAPSAKRTITRTEGRLPHCFIRRFDAALYQFAVELQIGIHISLMRDVIDWCLCRTTSLRPIAPANRGCRRLHPSKRISAKSSASIKTTIARTGVALVNEIIEAFGK